MPDQGCICITRPGDNYYCKVHGGNGSWAALLKAAAQSLRHCYDPAIAKQVREALGTIPEDHGLREQVEEILEREKPIMS